MAEVLTLNESKGLGKMISRYVMEMLQKNKSSKQLRKKSLFHIQKVKKKDEKKKK